MKEQHSGATAYLVFVIIGIAFLAISLAVHRGFIGVGAAFFVIGLVGMINKGVEKATAEPPAEDADPAETGSEQPPLSE